MSRSRLFRRAHPEGSRLTSQLIAQLLLARKKEGEAAKIQTCQQQSSLNKERKNNESADSVQKNINSTPSHDTGPRCAHRVDSRAGPVRARPAASGCCASGCN